MSVAARPKRPARTRSSPPASERPSRSSGPAGRARRPTVKPVRAVVPVISGLVWGLVLMGAVAASSLLTVIVLSPVAVLATVTAIRSTEGKRRRPGRRLSPLVMGGVIIAVVDPLVALAGGWAGGAVLVLSGAGIGMLLVVTSYAASARPLRAVAVRFVAAFVPTLAVTSVVVARHQGSNLALAMVGATLAYDMGAFLMGNGRTALGGTVGVAAGALSMAVVAIFVAAVMNPPFSGSRPVVVFVGAALLAPLGVRLCQWPAGSERLPALRRLDSLSLVAPAWVLMTGLLLHR